MYAIRSYYGLYYPSRLLRGPVDVIAKNTLKQSDLWKFGISGDHPIMLYRINDVKQIDELKNVVLAYEYMRKNGIRPDLVILNEEEASYLQTLHQKIEEVITGRRIYYRITSYNVCYTKLLRKQGLF